jgi:hypothetical protein
MEDKKKPDPSAMYHLALTPEEFQTLKKMLAKWERTEKMITSHERVEWFWSTAGVWLKWIAAIGASLVAVKLLLSDFKELLRGWIK